MLHYTFRSSSFDISYVALKLWELLNKGPSISSKAEGSESQVAAGSTRTS